MASQDGLQTVTIPFSRGLDERTQLEALDPTAGFPVLENLRMRTRGAWSKRYGFSRVQNARSGFSGAHLFPWTRESYPAIIAQFAGQAAYQVQQQTPNDAADGWPTTSVTRASEVMASRIAIASIRDHGGTSNTAPVGSIDSATLGPWLVTSVVVGGTADIIVSDGSQVLGRVQLPSVDDLRLVTTDDVSGVHQVAVVYSDPATTKIYIRSLTWSSGAPVLGTANAFVGYASTPSQWWDACSSNGGVLVAVRYTSTQVSCGEFSSSLTLVDSFSLTESSVTGVGVGSFGTGASKERYVAVFRMTDVELKHIDAAGTVTSLGVGGSMAGVTAMSVLPLAANGSCIVLVNLTSGCYAVRVEAMTVSTGSRVLPSLQFSTRGYLRNGAAYAVVTTAHPSDSLCVLAELFRPEDSDALSPYIRPVASVAPRLVATASSRLSALVMIDSYMYGAVAVGLSSASSAITCARFDFSRRWASVGIASCRYIAGGLVEKYDGSCVTEAAFLHRPSILSSDISGSGVISTTNGPIRYCFVFEAVDNRGNVEWSAPSAPGIITSATRNQLVVTVTPLNLTQRMRSGTSVKVVLYRTVSGGNNFYRVESKPNTGAVLTFTDNTADSVLQARALLYKSPGLAQDFADRNAPSAMYPMIVHEECIVGAKDDGFTLAFSNAAVEGEGVYWNELFEYPIQEGGPVTGLASQDGELYVFKRNSIYSLSGDGYTENGLGGYTLQRLPSDVGCIEPRSVVVTSVGVFFRSAKGIEILQRGGAVSWIGAEVVESLTPGVNIVSATSDQAHSVVIWSCEGTSGAFSLVYDYVNGVWSRDSCFGGTLATSTSFVQCASSYRYARLHADGSVWIEDDTGLDDGEWVTSQLETAWVRTAGLVGEQDIERVMLLAEYQGPHQISPTCAYDDRKFAFVTSYTPKTNATLYSLTASGQRRTYRLELLTNDNKRSSAIRIRLVDAPPEDGIPEGGNGLSFGLIGLVFEGSPRPGRERGGKAGR